MVGGLLRDRRAAVLRWFFHHDYAVDLARGVRYVFGAPARSESSDCPETPSPGQFYVELMSTSSNSSSSSTSTPSDAPSPPPYEDTTPSTQSQSESDPLVSDNHHNEPRANGLAAESNYRAEPSPAEDSGHLKEQQSTRVAFSEAQLQGRHELPPPPPHTSESFEEDAVGDGPDSPSSPESSATPGSLDTGLEPEGGVSGIVTESHTDDLAMGRDTEPPLSSEPTTIIPSPSEVSTPLPQDSSGQNHAEETSLSAIESRPESVDVEVAMQAFSAPGTPTPSDQTLRQHKLQKRNTLFCNRAPRSWDLETASWYVITTSRISYPIGTNLTSARHLILLSMLPWILNLRRTDRWYAIFFINSWNAIE